MKRYSKEEISKIVREFKKKHHLDNVLNTYGKVKNEKE